MTGDARLLVTGDATYADDIHLPGMLHVVFVRSPHAHAQILSIDTRETLAAHGVVTALVASDLGALNAPLPQRFRHPGLLYPRMPRPLADGFVRFVGSAVAAVVAEDRYAAADAAELVRVDYAPLPAAASLEHARAPGAPRVHDEAAENVAGTYRWRVGDPDRAFAGAPVRLSLRLAISRGAAVPIETRGCVAMLDPATDQLIMWASTQNPHYLQQTLAEMLQWPVRRVRVVAPEVGGAFGVKGGSPREYIVAGHLAARTGRPVKWIEDRREHLIACQHDRDQIHHLEIAGTADGDLLALRDLFWLDVGAYTMYGHLIGIHTVGHMIGPYRLPHLDVRLEAIYTHRVPSGAYRGAGRPQGTFVIERVMDHLARALDLDPVAVRRRNLIPPGAMPHDTGLRQPNTGPVRYDSGDYPRVLQTVLDRFDYAWWRGEQQRRRRAGGGRLGIAVALYVEETAAPGHETVTIRLERSGQVVVTAGPPSQGQGLAAILTRIIGRELAIPPGGIRFATGDTATTSESVGTHGSRVATMIGNAATTAARDLAARLRTLAADAAGCRADDVELRDGRAVRRGETGAGVGYAELIRYANPDGATGKTGGLHVSAAFAPRGSAWSSGAHAAAIEVDPEIGEVRILRYLVVHDPGVALDADAVIRQILGGVAQGIGGTVMERLVYDESGQPLTTSLMDYALPRAHQVPPIEIILLETPSPLNPLGLKGVGEAGCMAAYAVIASAVEDALAEQGHRITSLPFTAREMWRLARQTNEEDR